VIRFRSVRAGVMALLSLTASAILARAAELAPTYASLEGTVQLDNARVRVEKYLLQPGRSTGRHTHPADQLLVFIRGGVLRSVSTGRATFWREGRVVWESAGDPADPGSTNVGTTPIVMISVTFKPVVSTASRAGDARPDPYGGYLNYPNIPGEDLLENDRIIVQRFTVNPGQWEGVHAHRPNMLYIHIRGGQWAARSKSEGEHPYPEPSPDGEVGWMRTIDLGEGHESGNIGKTPIDLIWVTLKR
jgi:quercetin dioxygenase-like cupin family protein